MTLFTSADKKNTRLRHGMIFAPVSGFVALFGIVYEIFGHGVKSPYMHYAFLIPAVCAMLFVVLHFLGKYVSLCPAFYNCIDAACATLTVGSIFRGVIDIYGTTYKMLSVYLYVGAFLIALAVVSLAICNLNGKGKNEENKKSEV